MRGDSDAILSPVKGYLKGVSGGPSDKARGPENSEGAQTRPREVPNGGLKGVQGDQKGPREVPMRPLEGPRL
jgi:hypothetical protein